MTSSDNFGDTGPAADSNSMSHKEAKMEAAAAKARAKAARPWYQKKRVIIPGVLVLLAVVGAVTDSDTGGTASTAPPTTAPAPSAPAPSAPATPPSTSAPSTTESAPSSNLTRSQQNAVRSAEGYLSFSAFSRTGLIDQLKFEGYSDADATFAVDSLNVDWREQAAKSAESYLSFMPFSRSGLIDQLVFEGFTRDEAEYGVTQAGL